MLRIQWNYHVLQSFLNVSPGNSFLLPTLHTTADQWNIIHVPVIIDYHAHHTRDSIVQEEQQCLLHGHILVADMTLPALVN